MRAAKDIIAYAASLADPSAEVEVTPIEAELLIRHCFAALNGKKFDEKLARAARLSIKNGTAELCGRKLVLKTSGEMVFQDMLPAVESKETDAVYSS
jgi:hypothetical protein